MKTYTLKELNKLAEEYLDTKGDAFYPLSEFNYLMAVYYEI